LSFAVAVIRVFCLMLGAIMIQFKGSRKPCQLEAGDSKVADLGKKKWL
jgi:hypothetical protein